jgi:ubiquinone/menaquinone biosynthesis C-methylase UbiE
MEKKDAKRIMNDLRKDYNLTASSFASSRDRLWPEFSFLFDSAREGERVLDLGCGNGRFSQCLEKTDYTGIDFSEELIKEAKKRFPQKRFLVANVLKLPFKEKFFDKVYSIAVIHQIPSHEKRIEVLQETKRVLKEGGKAFFTVWNMDEETKKSSREISADGKEVFLKRKRYYYLFKKEEFSSLFKEAGFLVEEDGTLGKERACNFYVIAQKKTLTKM